MSVEDHRAQQVIQVGNQQVPLPEGVTVAQWALERTAWQNPRIRAFLGCIHLLEGVLESNYAILHCSPERLLDIWRKVRQVSRLLSREVAPLLERPSCIPRLEEARRASQVSLTILQEQVLGHLERFPEEVPPERYLELRKLLCVSIGQLHAFLQDTFGELMAADPRSVHDADYFLSRRFPRDIEEAEWLLATVGRLQGFLGPLLKTRQVRLSEVAAHLRRERRLPAAGDWRRVEDFLATVLDELTAKLHEVLALRGIRFDELEVIDRYSSELPVLCRETLDLYDLATELLRELEPGSGEATAVNAILARRTAARLQEIEERLQDLVAFLPLWLAGIERRRALMFRRRDGEEG